MGEEDNIDRAFFHCLKEIEISYTSLPKILRLRIEKWVEKFMTVGFNLIWKKNRNMYAKLLLSMIISKTLSDPFHCNPAEGEPLAPFPSYLIPKFKSALGPHESYFWRNIFDRVHEPALVTYAPPPPPPHNHESSSDFGPAPSPSYVKLDPSQKETYNLRLLMKEQSRRIELMEEQMQQERLKHQRDMQHVLLQSQDEANRVKSMYRNSNIENHSGYSHRNDSVVSSNPYEMYDGNTTYGNRRPRSPQRSPGRRPGHFSSTSYEGHQQQGSSANAHSTRLNASYLPQELSRRSVLDAPIPNPIRDSKYPQHHNPHSKFKPSEAYEEQQEEYSIGVPVFTPGKEDKDSGFVDSSSQQKNPLRSSSKSVNFLDNKHDIRPLSFAVEDKESKDIIPPHPRARGDIAPAPAPALSPLTSSLRGGGGSRGHRPDSSYDFLPAPRSPSPGRHDHLRQPRSPAANSPPFAKESIWPNYYDLDCETNASSPTTYELARNTINRPDSDVAPILKREVPEDQGEFMSYLEDFQKEIRHLQFNTKHNKAA